MRGGMVVLVRTYRAQSGALLLVMGIAACNVLLGYDEGQQETGGSSATGVGGDPAGGGGSTAIGGGGSSEGGSGGAEGGAGPCAPTINVEAASCSDQCTSLIDDADCDGLPDALRDPQQGQCNPLLLAVEFDESPDMDRWVLLNGASWGWSDDRCGSLELGADTDVVLGPADTALLTEQYLVEVELSLRGAIVPAAWDAVVQTGHGAAVSYSCSLWRHPSHQPQGGVHLVRLGEGPCSDGGWWTTGILDDSADTTYLLQSWHDGNGEICRAFSEVGQPVLQTLTRDACPTGPGGTIRLLALQSPVAIHSVRVFEIL